jgi:myo-inositol-1-phosphate synthase
MEVTVERSESEINRTAERQHHVQRVNSFTEKQKRKEEEAAMRYYVCRALHHGCKCINVVHFLIRTFPHIFVKFTKKNN